MSDKIIVCEFVLYMGWRHSSFSWYVPKYQSSSNPYWVYSIIKMERQLTNPQDLYLTIL